MGMLLTASRSFAVTPTGAAVARTRLPMPIREFRRAEILHAYQERSSLRGLTRTFGVSRTTVSSWIKKKELSFLPYVPPCSPRTQRIPLPRRWNWTNCGRLSSKKRTTAGCGLPCAARRVKWWRMRLGIGAKRRVNACGRPFQRAIVLVTASRISGQRIRRSSRRSSTQPWAKRREKQITWSAGITPCSNGSPVLSA